MNNYSFDYPADITSKIFQFKTFKIDLQNIFQTSYMTGF